MVQVTARLPDALGAELDATAQQLNRCWADIISQAIEYYLDDIEDLRCGIEALKDAADPVLDWAEVRNALLAARTGVEAIDLLSPPIRKVVPSTRQTQGAH
jgi:RHH-type rel operon transcriptional repressor/antitoxin RelB